MEQLKEVIQEIENSGIFQTDPKKDDLKSEISTGKTTELSAYLLERLLMSYEKDRSELKMLEESCKDLESLAWLNLVWLNSVE